MSASRPNVVFVFADQMRAQATGYAGDPNVRTPNLDALAGESLRGTHAVAGCPVCSPYRASLITGRYPHTHGVFLNDAPLGAEAVSAAQAFAAAGYDTAYVGKWHLNGGGRSEYIPPHRRQGFDYWKVLQCTHDYNRSAYYAGDSDEMRHWRGYDALAQTRDAQAWLRRRDAGAKPFLLMLSWGPPHNPYETAPGEFADLYGPERVRLRPNVPAACADRARRDLAGYYAHISALDFCVGELLATLREARLDENTLFVFTSDHGDMHGSHGAWRKQWPFDESIRVPFLLRWPAGLAPGARQTNLPIDAPDVLPTLLGLARADIPETVEGADFSARLAAGNGAGDDEAALLACYWPFSEWRPAHGGREYRGLRTAGHTYVRALDGPWLLFDNHADPYQQRNLVADADTLRRRLDARLDDKLAAVGDDFRPGRELLETWGYEVDETGAMPCAP